MRYLSAMALAVLLASGARASTTYYNHTNLVKEQWRSGWQAGDDYTIPSEIYCRRLSFTPRQPEVPISGYSNDPRVETSDTSIIYWPPNECNVKQDPSNGRWTSYFYFRAASLKDLGTHAIRCDGLISYIGHCVSKYKPPCNIACERNLAVPANGLEWFVNVVNLPPEATTSYAPTSVAWNSTVTLSASGQDRDNPYPGDTNKYRWSISSRPPNAVANITQEQGPQTSITFNDERNIGLWQFRLEVDDDEGQVVANSVGVQFTVPNAVPDFIIQGASQVVLPRPIQLGSNKLTDDDGGNLSFVWDILQTPSRSLVRPQANYSTAHTITLPPTTGADIGDWVFRLAAKDNEGALVSRTVTIKVVNSPPRIAVSGPSEIDTGQPLQLKTTVLTDDDGGNLNFRWEVVQQPGTTGSPLPYAISTTPFMSIPTLHYEGTWIFRLTAMDDEGDSIQAEHTVLVDGVPYAQVRDINGDDYENAPLIIHVGESMPVLYGWAYDPDSPCEDLANHCHRTDGRPASISPGIVKYEWHITRFPPEANGALGDTYHLGPLRGSFDEVEDDTPQLNMVFEYIPEGDWTFELRVTDGEGNEVRIPSHVRVQQAPSPPEVTLGSDLGNVGNRITTQLDGVLPREVKFTGYAIDWDNGLSYYQGHPSPTEQLAPWTGIVGYRWQAVPPSPDCPVPPLPTEKTLTLYPAGAVVPPACLGRWRMRFIVTDDDRQPLTRTAEYAFTLGNCAAKVCIDAPRSAAPAVLSTGGSGVIIGYHPDAALYDEPVFGVGIHTRVEIIKSGDTLPLYTSTTGPILQSGRGRLLFAYWNGLTQTGAALPEGTSFHLRVSLVDANGTLLHTATESWAIVAQPLKLVFNEPSTRYLPSSTSGTSVSFTLTGAQSPVDSFQVTLRDSAGRIVRTFSAAYPATSMPLPSLSPPGHYTLEIAAIRGGIPHALSTQRLVAYRYAVQAEPGVTDLRYILVNNDDDNANGVKDSEEALPAGDDELVPVKLLLEPPVPGTLSLEHTLGTGVLRAWRTLSKTGELALPATLNVPAEAAPATLYIEPLKEGGGVLRLSFTPADGVPLPVSTLRVEAHRVDAVQDSDEDQTVEEEDAMLSFVRADRWDNAYDGAFNVLNGVDPHHFVARDPSRFYLRARGPSYAVNTGTVETANFSLSVRHGNSIQDNSVQMPLVETGAGTSLLASRALMMTGLDIEGIPRTDTDDGFAAHNGTTQVVADNTLGDRTFRSNIESVLNLRPQTFHVLQTWRMPVCGPTRRKVDLRVHIFLEPFQDIGVDPDGNPATADLFGRLNGQFDFIDSNVNGRHDLGERSEPYVDLSEGATTPRTGNDVATLSARGPITPYDAVWRDLRHTDILWAPACIRTSVPSMQLFTVDAPTHNFVNVLMDGVITNDEFGAIYDKFGDSMTEDVVDVFYGPRIEVHRNDGTVAHAAGRAFPALEQTARIPHGEKMFMLVQAGLPMLPIVAHELAHILTNTEDRPGNQTYFYPTTGAAPFTQVNLTRRMPQSVEVEARTLRAAGDMVGLGNRQLKTY